MGRLPLHVLGRIAQGDAHPTALEHLHVGGLIAERRDGLHRDLQVARQPLDDAAFVGRRMRHVEVVRLRPRGGHLRAERVLKFCFTRGDAGVVIADADDLHHVGENSVEGGYHFRLGLDRRLFAGDARRLTGTHVPVGRSVDPHVQPVRLDGFDDCRDDVVRDPAHVEHRQVGEHDHPAVEGRHRHRQSERLDQHPQAAWRPAAADGEHDSALSQLLHGLNSQLGQHLVLRDQRAVDISQYRGDWLGGLLRIHAIAHGRPLSFFTCAGRARRPASRMS